MMKLLQSAYIIFLLLFSLHSIGQTVTMSSQSALPGETVSYPIVAAGLPSGIGAVTINVLVDTTVLKCIGHTPGTLGAYYINFSGNPILVSWSNPGGANVNGTMLTLQFKVRGGTSALDFTNACEIATAIPPEPIAVTWVDGAFTPKATSTYYVDAAVSSSGNGLSWATALKKISESTNKALAAGDKVLIKPGTYNDTMIVKSNGYEIVPLTFNVTVSDTNKITFPASADLNSIDLTDYPGKYYAYLGRSWKGNNGVYKVIQVNKASKYVIVEGAEFYSETGAASDSSKLQAAIGFPVSFEKYATNPLTERITLTSSGISGERATLHIGKPTSAGDFNVNAANYNIIDGIDLTGADQIGLRIQNSKFNVYKNSKIYELDSIGVMISGNTAKPANCNFILNNEIYNTKQKAIKVGIQSETSANNRANLNHFKGNEIYSTLVGANINYTNAVDICRYTGYTVLESNTFRNFKLKTVNRGAIEIKNNVRRLLAYSNYIKNIDRVTASDYHSIFYLMNNGNNNNVYNNVIVDSAAVDNNIFAFWVNGNGGYTAGLIAYNSVHKVDNGFRLESGAPSVDFTIKDNIMNIDPTLPDQFNITGAGTYTVAYNCYSTTPTAYLTETGRLVADPVYLLPGTYQSPFALSLQASSPCLNSGNPISGILTDMRKVIRNGSTPSRGAHEQVLSTFYWTGAISTNWHDNRNWDVKMVPSTSYNVIIPDRTNDPVISTSNVTIKTLQVISPAQIHINSPRTLTLTN
jgi:hypothetical protein